MKEWLTHIETCLKQAAPAVLVTVTETKGSVPREVGAKLVVSADKVFGSIGGGHLEFAAIGRARDKLAAETFELPDFQDFPLGPTLGQCCGGFVRVMYEPINAHTAQWMRAIQQPGVGARPIAIVTDTLGQAGMKSVVTPGSVYGAGLPASIVREARVRCDAKSIVGLHRHYLIEPVVDTEPQVYLFGAGHVGKALVDVLSSLPVTVHWIDSRDNEFPPEIKGNTRICISDEPEYEVDAAPPDTIFLVMTHSHALDFNICLRVLEKGGYGFLGLIGSASKRSRFARRLAARGVAEERIQDLVSPIGIEGIEGKQPAVIAVAVAAQVMQLAEQMGTASGQLQLESAADQSR